MPRIGTPREPGQASTPRQLARNAAILRSAARLGALHGLEHVQISDIAADAGVALGTLYRYYPSKHHLFAALLTSSIWAIPEPVQRPGDRAAAVSDYLGEATERLLAQPLLARAMMVSVNAVRTSSDAAADLSTRQRILAIAGITEPTDEDQRLARLVEQCTYGILTWAAAGQLDAATAVSDVRHACDLLLAPWRGQG
ncbi:AcrR family transcriptional regulator [Mycobacterium frederiksbergense]|jgi:AcrR family transcriptional regulator|uniref:AcrR family transcriptional regulator n=1 Tax=Mycolicibacterium frederiksbergense TaxID=117567 RepID=A0ABT6L287_9MYCO|nr:TetR family transcriptional regulator [Mycolicibacterium frederiksbergense]MDH6197064.1 AcrR family transcriptional regulator [Mycolicibacterium frederiksbergense]